MENDLEYAILQKEYRQMHTNNSNIFPEEWYYVKEYDLKKAILDECIRNKSLITDSSYYLTFKNIALNAKNN